MLLAHRSPPGLFLILCLGAAACTGFKTPAAGDAGDAAANAETGPASENSLPATDRGRAEAVKPGQSCRPLQLPCLDPAPANVIEVPSEASAAQAFASANSGDTIQIRGLQLSAGWAIPPYATLRGCAGAKIIGAIRFAGSGGVVEGFDIPAQVVANATGSYVVRYNRFPGGGAPEAGVSARSIDALVAASVVIVMESNWFEKRPFGVEARTKYDTLTHEVDLTVRNNIFSGVDNPVVVSEGGLVGKIKALVEQNTFYDFKTAISLYDIGNPTVLGGNLLVKGSLGIEAAASAFELRYCMGWQVTTPHSLPPLAGVLATGDPRLIDAAAGNFSLSGGSSAIDKIPAGTTVPNEDYLGCPRPIALLGSDAKADIGALEAQR